MTTTATHLRVGDAGVLLRIEIAVPAEDLDATTIDGAIVHIAEEDGATEETAFGINTVLTTTDLLVLDRLTDGSESPIVGTYYAVVWVQVGLAEAGQTDEFNIFDVRPARVAQRA